MTGEPRPVRFSAKISIVGGIAIAWLVLLAAPWSGARHHRRQAAAAGATFDYYLFSLSWAPTYCHDHPGDHSTECQSGRQTAFVLHGLWPQAEDGPPPMSCAPASPVAASLVDYLLQYFPSRGLIQHEWEEHGTCSGLSAQEYFHQAEQAFRKVQVPQELRDLDRERDFSVRELEQRFAEVNHAAPASVRVSCHNRELVNVEICLSQDLQFRSCTASVRECPADRISLLPPH